MRAWFLATRLPQSTSYFVGVGLPLQSLWCLVDEVSGEGLGRGGEAKQRVCCQKKGSGQRQSASAALLTGALFSSFWKSMSLPQFACEKLLRITLPS